MPAKKKSNRTAAGAAKKAVSKINLFKVSLKYLTWVFLILLGGFLFNLDRMGDFGIQLLKHKELIPYRLRFFLPGGTAADGQAERNETLIGRVIEVYDGDTVTLLTRDKKYRIRFYGIDAPEAKQNGGIASRDALREKILGQEVTVTVMNLDRYGRAVGKVAIGGRDINLEMVREGRAWYYENYARGEEDLEEAQERARKAKLGIWSEDSPTPPWRYRKESDK